MVGVDFNEAGQLNQLKEITAFRDEYTQFPQDRTADPKAYYVGNHSYMTVDGEVLHRWCGNLSRGE